MADPVTLFNSSGGVEGTFTTIQAAVTAAAGGAGPNQTIQVDGSQGSPFSEQVTVDGSNANLAGLTIEGINNAVLQAPSTLLQTATDPAYPNPSPASLDGILTIANATGVTVKGLTVDGATVGGNEVGILAVNSTGTTIGGAGAANAVTVENVQDPAGFYGDQRGFGIYVSNSYANEANTVTIDNTTVKSFQKDGILVANANATIENNTIIGTVNTVIAQNGIEIGGASQVYGGVLRNPLIFVYNAKGS